MTQKELYDSTVMFIYAYIFTRWTGRIFWKGYHHTLDEADVYDVLPRDSTVKLSSNLARYVQLQANLFRPAYLLYIYVDYTKSFDKVKYE